MAANAQRNRLDAAAYAVYTALPRWPNEGLPYYHWLQDKRSDTMPLRNRQWHVP